MTGWQLAQLNVARLIHPIDDPRIRDFVDGLDAINRLAEESEGFVWRLKTDSGNATDVTHPWSADPFMLVNMSVWRVAEDLRQYVYKSGHMEYLRRRMEWFERPAEAHYVLWWVEAGHVPTLEEAQERLEHYRAHGATARAFWFGRLFEAPAFIF
ncbi:MAG: DUF3291 domain-containing protein [Acidobacteria bacterium]|nr:DUF3291 domain-containing protein [Acidobacteriota bacterium]